MSEAAAKPRELAAGCTRLVIAAAMAAFAACATAADFATPGGPEPAGISRVSDLLHEDPYDLELLVSFGTSKGGSAGHLAIALRGAAPGGDDMVYSANFYADREPEHERDFYTRDLMVRVPKMEYLYRTSSSLGERAQFGLDFGEAYKRSVVGVRVYGVPAREKEALAAYFDRINADYHRRARDTEYQHGEVKYGYLTLNCAKTVGSAFKYGAGYADLPISSAKVLPNRRVTKALNANTPTSMAMSLLREFHVRGYRMDVVLYRKYADSGYVDPHEEEKVAFRDLPNRFPSVISLDFRNDDRAYEDYDNLFAMYLLQEMKRYDVRIDPKEKRIEVAEPGIPMPYAKAVERAARDAESDRRGFLRRLLFPHKGTRIDEDDSTGPVAAGRGR